MAPIISCSDYYGFNDSHQGLNDSLSFVVFTSELLLDTWAISEDENEWWVIHLNSGEEIFYQDSSPYDTVQLVSNEVCLQFNNTAAAISNGDDCYYFLLVDHWGDGLGASGAGDNYWLRLDTTVIEDGAWKDGDSLRVDFCIS